MLSYDTAFDDKCQTPDEEKEFPYKKPKDLNYTLDSNHDFFVLTTTIEEEFKIRTELITALADLNKPKTPIVNVLIEGGESAIEAVSKGLEDDIPCIVVSGTGRAADIFAECINGIYLTEPFTVPVQFHKKSSKIGLLAN